MKPNISPTKSELETETEIHRLMSGLPDWYIGIWGNLKQFYLFLKFHNLENLFKSRSLSIDEDEINFWFKTENLTFDLGIFKEGNSVCYIRDRGCNGKEYCSEIIDLSNPFPEGVIERIKQEYTIYEAKNQTKD